MIIINPYQLARSPLYKEFYTAKTFDFIDQWIGKHCRCSVEVIMVPDEERTLSSLDVKEFHLTFDNPNQELIFRLKYL